ncbi:TAF5-like RNA polymerase II p300/CBP-associated factor-associated factor 65 kDa subunit 5L [Octopus sinensis]|uniref:TAF5-like RNA polymerase II p300/CBP-associated factor-associated factor 65 kDa subunit 5L n=1 Tax=Octopus sinensis TaxID=2607531 RepID=A0A6P7TH18_9MOLL|nr:TAF5-like RNA polymerase II p300/CBP-associated factor-associated factor 65 kDa subunit 5L [Octopus sinensis]
MSVEWNSFDFLQYLKMKRIKNEQIQMSMSNYLKRRQYPESSIPGKRNHQYIQEPSELVSQNNVHHLSTINNVLAYSSITGDATACDHQFSQLKQFICDAVEPYRTELHILLFPIFVHVYLEMLYNGHKSPAHKFHARHVTFFREDSENQDILDTLVKLNNREDVLTCKLVAEFRDHKYSLAFTQDTFDYLVRFLKADDNMIMLQIFNKHLKVEVKGDKCPVFECKPQNLQSEINCKSADPHLPALTSANADKSPATDQVTKEMLLECIKSLQVLPPCLPSICFLAIATAHHSLSCASVSDDRKYVAGGFEDSSIRLWTLGASIVRTPPTKMNPSRITLSADSLLYKDKDNVNNHYDDWSAAPDQCVVLRGHSGSIYNMCFLPDPDPVYLLSCSKDTTVRLWNLENCCNTVRYAGHNYPVWDIDVCRVSSMFVSGSCDRTAKLWSTDRIFPVRTFAGHTLDVSRVKFHPNGMYVATGSSDRSVRLWSINDGKCVRLMQGHRGTVLAMAFSPNGQYLATSGDDKKIRIWDLNTGNLFKEFRGHVDTVYSLTFCRDGSMLASGGLDSSIRIWDVRKEGDFSNASLDTTASPEQLACYPTKSTPIHFLNFTSHNLLLGAGPLL